MSEIEKTCSTCNFFWIGKTHSMCACWWGDGLRKNPTDTCENWFENEKVRSECVTITDGVTER